MSVFIDPETGELVRDDGPAPFQLFAALDPATESALRASIDRFGVLVPVHRDQHGRTLDGHHRARIADELGVPYQVNIVIVSDDDEAAEIARTLNADRRHLSAEQRRDLVKALLEEVDSSGIGVHSPNAVADALGVDLRTVQRDQEQLTQERKLLEPSHRRGQDGKVRPAKRPTQVHAKNQREAKRAQEALDQLGDAVPSVPVLDVKRTERIAREKAADERRTQPVAPAVDSTIRIEHCRIEDLDIAPGTVSLILTDPPYPAEYLDLWSVLAERAATWLTPHGALLAYSSWHRTHRVAKLLGGDHRAAHELGVIDIDWCEYCRWCSEPLALIETQASRNDPKPARVTQILADRAGIQAWSVSYVVEDDDIVWFKRRQLSPVLGVVLNEAPDEYARWLLSLRWAHRFNCTKAGRL